MNQYDKILLASVSGSLIVVVIVLLLIIRMLKRSGAAKTKGAMNSKLVNTLRDEKLKSGIILNAIEDGVVLVDDQQVIRLFNPGASKITGWSGDDAVGLAWQAVFKIVNAKGEAVAAG